MLDYSYKQVYYCINNSERCIKMQNPRKTISKTVIVEFNNEPEGKSKEW